MTHRILFATGALALILAGCIPTTINSHWRSTEITVDGADQDWVNAPGFYDAKSKTLFSVLNDDKYLYLRIKTESRDLPMKVLRRGLTVWFSANGSKTKQFGLNFPMMTKLKNMTGPRPDMARRDAPPKMGFDKPLEGEPHKPTFDLEALEKVGLELIGPTADERHWMWLPTAATQGVAVKLGMEEEVFVYELKVPLQSHRQFDFSPVSLDPEKPTTIAIGFETGEVKMDRERPGGPGGGGEGPGGRPEGGGGMGGPGGMGGGGMGGGGMGGGGPGGGMGGGGRGSGGMKPDGGQQRGDLDTSPFSLWIKVKLATATTSDN